MTDADRLVPVFIPPLAATLRDAERRKGAPLVEAEVLAIRDDCPCMMMPVAVRDQLADSRGYPDLDPENCWPEWVALRAELSE